MTYRDRVASSTTTTGAGNITLAAAPAGFVAPGAAFAVGDTGVPFVFVERATGAFEVSLCTLVDAATLSRDTVLASSNGGALVNFGAGTKDIWHDVPASVIADLLSNRPLSAGDVTSAAGTDLVVLVVAGEIKRITLSNLATLLGIPPTGSLLTESGSPLATESGQILNT